jgi:hypothetical protein
MAIQRDRERERKMERYEYHANTALKKYSPFGIL